MREEELLANGLELKGVGKSFDSGSGKIHVLQDLNLTVPRGSFAAIMGASGSGKTTLLNIAGGLLVPDSGSVFVGGRCLDGLSDAELTRVRRDQIGFIFQMFNLVPSLTVEENVLLPLLAGSEPCGDEERRSCREFLTRAGLGDRLDYLPGRLSGGERQRVAIARALWRSPDLVLADEPTGNLDSASTAMVGSLLRELHQETGVTTILVTHDPAVAMWAQRVIVLKDGMIAADSPTSAFASASDLSLFYSQSIDSFPS